MSASFWEGFFWRAWPRSSGRRAFIKFIKKFPACNYKFDKDMNEPFFTSWKLIITGNFNMVWMHHYSTCSILFFFFFNTFKQLIRQTQLVQTPFKSCFVDNFSLRCAVQFCFWFAFKLYTTNFHLILKFPFDLCYSACLICILKFDWPLCCLWVLHHLHCLLHIYLLYFYASLCHFTYKILHLKQSQQKSYSFRW